MVLIKSIYFSSSLSVSLILNLHYLIEVCAAFRTPNVWLMIIEMNTHYFWIKFIMTWLTFVSHFRSSNSLTTDWTIFMTAAILACLSFGSCVLPSPLMRSWRHGLLGQLCLLPSNSNGISLPLLTIFLSKCIAAPQLNRHFVSLIFFNSSLSCCCL